MNAQLRSLLLGSTSQGVIAIAAGLKDRRGKPLTFVWMWNPLQASQLPNHPLRPE